MDILLAMANMTSAVMMNRQMETVVVIRPHFINRLVIVVGLYLITLREFLKVMISSKLTQV